MKQDFAATYRLRLLIPVLVAIVVSACSGGQIPTSSVPVPQTAFSGKRDNQSPPPSLLVTLPSDNAIAIIDTASQTIRGIGTVPGGPTEIVIHPFRHLAYVVVNSGTAIAIFDIFEQKTIGSIAVPAGVTHLVIGREGNRLYAVNSSGTVSVISISSDVVLQTVDLGVPTGGIAYSSVAHRIFVSAPTENSIAVIDSVTLQLKRPIFAGHCSANPVGPCRPENLMTSVDDKYVLAAARATILAVDAVTGAILAKTGDVGFCCDEQLLGVNPAMNELVAAGARVNQTPILVSTQPPFNVQGSLGTLHRSRILSVAFDPTTDAAYGTQDIRTGRVVFLPYHRPNRSIWLGNTPDRIVYAP